MQAQDRANASMERRVGPETPPLVLEVLTMSAAEEGESVFQEYNPC